jgi:transglutaminase-like putative cysteine protease
MVQMQRGAQTGRAFQTLGRDFSAAQNPTITGPETLPSHPAFDGRAVRYTIESRPAGADDETATGQTIAAMYDYSSADAADAQVQAVAAECTAGRHEQAQQLAGIFEWLRRNLRYVEDKQLAFFRPTPDDAEVLIRPADLVRMEHPQGDCDEYSMCARSLMLACGIPAAFVTVEADEDVHGAYSHVYVIAYSDRGPVPFDAIPATRRGLGYEVTPTGKRRVWPAPRATMLRTTTQAAPGRPATAYTRLTRAARGVLTPEVLAKGNAGTLGAAVVPAAGGA